MNAEAIDLLIRTELPAAARGERDAYGRIVGACQNAVTAVALAITRDVPASEDIAQDAFLAAWQNLKRLQNPSSFLSWLRQITRHLARDHLRATRHRPPDGEGPEIPTSPAAHPPHTPAHHLAQHDRDQPAAQPLPALPADRLPESLHVQHRGTTTPPGRTSSACRTRPAAGTGYARSPATSPATTCLPFATGRSPAKARRSRSRWPPIPRPRRRSSWSRTNASRPPPN